MHRNTINAFFLIIISCYFGASDVFAVDGDVTYGSPYLWVDPETGEIETVNPGPQPKAHVLGLDDEGPSSQNSGMANQAATKTAVTGSVEGADNETTTSFPLGILGGIALILVAAGFILRRSSRSNQTKTISS